jgi:TRAP-type mannitol/chloroaromatic compound transport system permease small subunit
MNAIIRAVDRLNQFIGLSVTHLYLICVVITIYEVVMRYFFNAPTQWAFEIVMVVCATAWALSGGYISMRKSHIAITILHERAKRSRALVSRHVYFSGEHRRNVYFCLLLVGPDDARDSHTGAQWHVVQRA